MRARSILTIVLSLFVIISVAVVLRRQDVPAATHPENRVSAAPDEVAAPDDEPEAKDEASQAETQWPAEVTAKAGEPADVVEVERTVEVIPAVPDPVSDRRVVAIYFHGDVRCATCRKVEAYAREAVEEGFRERVTDGSVVFRTVNVDVAENKHYITDFNLVARSVVVVEEIEGMPARWTRLDDVWQLVGNHEKYLEYVRGAVSDLLEQG